MVFQLHLTATYKSHEVQPWLLFRDVIRRLHGLWRSYTLLRLTMSLLGQVKLIVSLSSPSISTELCDNGRHGTRITHKRQQ